MWTRKNLKGLRPRQRRCAVCDRRIKRRDPAKLTDMGFVCYWCAKRRGLM